MVRETGFLGGTHPYYRVGSGDRPLVVLPGLSDAFQGERPSRLVALALDRYYFRTYDEYAVYVVSRPRHLPDGQTTREMADAYATVLDRIGPAPVVGISLGGLVAQHLAVDHPEVVDRLVLAVSAARLGDDGRRILRRWRDWADAGLWFAAMLDSVPVTYNGWRRWLYPPLLRTLGHPMASEPADVDDVVVSCQACVDHDATDRLPDVDVPTLVVGGTDDRLFPPPLLESTAEGIPDARIDLFHGGAHGVYEERKYAFDAAVRSFLRATGT
jgi:pimeloyl-ACP methyl ester carboxylesterase